MTYLSQFPKAKLKPGAPLKPKLNPKKARAYGRGKCWSWDLRFGL
jgi:filamin